MTGPFSTAIIIVSLVLSAWAFLIAALNRPRSMALLGGLVILEVMLVVFLVGGIVQMIGTDHDFARIEFVGYLLACAAVLPAAAAWSWGEKGRAGVLVIAIALLVMPVLITRVQQVWVGPVG